MIIMIVSVVLAVITNNSSGSILYSLNFDHGEQSPGPNPYYAGTGETLPRFVTGTRLEDVDLVNSASSAYQGGQAVSQTRGASWPNTQGYTFGVATSYSAPWTIEVLLWCDFNDTGYGLCGTSTIFDGAPGTGSNGAHCLYIDQNTGILTWDPQYGGASVLSSSIALQENRWYHIAIVADTSSSQIKIFINGQVKGTTSIPSGWESAYGIPASFNLGSWTGQTGKNWQGQIDAFVIDKTALAQGSFHLPVPMAVCDIEYVGDFDGDCAVGFGDLLMLADDWLQVGNDIVTDIDDSNRIDFKDFVLFAENWWLGMEAKLLSPMLSDLDANNYKIFNISDLITMGPWVDARNYNGGAFDETTIQAAVSAIAGAERTVLLAPGTWQISSNLNIPSNITLRFEGGASLNILSGVTVTIQGVIEAGLYKIFDIDTGGMVDISGTYAISKDVYPQWWGAVEGSTTNPVILAQNAKAFKSAIATGKVFLPGGTYSVDDNIGSLSSGKLIGAGADCTVIETAENDVDILSITGGALVKNIGFSGGRRAVYLQNNNSNGVVNFDSCRFDNQVQASIDCDSNSSSALLIINGCKFVTATTGIAINADTNDCSINNCLIEANGEAAIVNRGSTGIRNLFGIAGVNTSTSCWVENHSNLLWIKGAYFGSGNGGRCIVENYASLDYADPIYQSGIIIENSDFNDCNDHILKFYELPNKLVLRNNVGYNQNNQKGVYLDTSISSSSKQYFPRYGYFDNSDKIKIYGPTELVGLVNGQDTVNLNYSVNPLTTDLIHSAPTGSGAYSEASTAPLSWVAYPYNGVTGRRYQATGQQNIIFYYSPAPSLFSNDNLYTAVLDFVCQVVEPVSVEISFGDRTETYIVSTGLQVLSVPYFWTTGKSTELRVVVNGLSSGDVVHTGRWRVFKNNHNSYVVNTVLYGSSAAAVPSSADIGFAKGDKIIHTDATAGGYKARQCTAAGNPGTWKEFGMISP